VLNLHGSAVNIATGAATSILELFMQLQGEFPHYAYKRIFPPERPEDIKHLQAFCKRLNLVRRYFMV
jgi:hypothetical protein